MTPPSRVLSLDEIDNLFNDKFLNFEENLLFKFKIIR